jgi:hypothetical protein
MPCILDLGARHGMWVGYLFNDACWLSHKALVPEQRSVETLASTPSLAVQPVPQEHCSGIDTITSGKIYTIRASKSTVCTVPSARERPGRGLDAVA